MKYYFVSPDGDYLYEEEEIRGCFTKETNPEMFTRKREAIAEQKRRMKARIAQLKETIRELK